VRLARWCQLALALALTVALQAGLVTVVLWGALQTATPAAWRDLRAVQESLTSLRDAITQGHPRPMWCGSAPSCNVRQAAMDRVKAAMAAVPSSWPKKPFNNVSRELFSGTCSVVFNSSAKITMKFNEVSVKEVVPLADPRCYLCSLMEANSSDCNITFVHKHVTPHRLNCVSPAPGLENSFCLVLLLMDLSLTSLLRSQMVKYYANPDDDRTQAEVMQQWPFTTLPVNDSAWDLWWGRPLLPLAPEPPPPHFVGAFGVAISLAVVLIAINVNKEVCRAHLLARLALTHSRCMPAFFAPLAILPLTPHTVTTPLAAVCMLALPVVQICVAVYVLFCASLVYELASETKDIISVIYNSAALLCVLELDNYVGSMISERIGTLSPLQGHHPSGPDHLELSQPAPGPRAQPAAAVVGYAYSAVLGALAIAEVLAAVMPLSELDVSGFQDTLKPNLNEFRSTGPAYLAFVMLYMAAVAALFDAPLPPAAKPSAWHALCKLAFANLASYGAYSRYADHSQRTRIVVFHCIALASLALFAIWPWARSCHLARRRGAITNAVPADTE
jgi:hypothetical protein